MRIVWATETETETAKKKKIEEVQRVESIVIGIATVTEEGSAKKEATGPEGAKGCEVIVHAEVETFRLVRHLLETQEWLQW